MKKIKIEELALQLQIFLEKHALDSRLFAKSVRISNDKMNEILSGERLATEEEYAETAIAMAIIDARGWHYWLSMSQEDKNELSAKFIAAGGSTMTVGGMIAVISACGVPGLSAAGIASGLATIGSLVGGGMVAGIAVCCTAPLVVGGALYGISKSVTKIINNKKNGNNNL